MQRFPLAKLVEWSGNRGVEGRKRLQKVVYFLQFAGCPFDAEYTLHRYGPYSRDVSECCDELVSAEMLMETTCGNTVGVEYTYGLTEKGRAALAVTSKRLEQDVASFKALAVELIGKELWTLELGSTILFCWDKSGDWDLAVRQACDFKKARPDAASTLSAIELAKYVGALRTK